MNPVTAFRLGWSAVWLFAVGSFAVAYVMSERDRKREEHERLTTRLRAWSSWREWREKRIAEEHS